MIHYPGGVQIVAMLVQEERGVELTAVSNRLIERFLGQTDGKKMRVA